MYDPFDRIITRLVAVLAIALIGTGIALLLRARESQNSASEAMQLVQTTPRLITDTARPPIR